METNKLFKAKLCFKYALMISSVNESAAKDNLNELEARIQSLKLSEK